MGTGNHDLVSKDDGGVHEKLLVGIFTAGAARAAIAGARVVIVAFGGMMILPI